MNLIARHNNLESALAMAGRLTTKHGQSFYIGQDDTCGDWKFTVNTYPGWRY